MLCPVCESELRETLRSGVSIDVCPRCKGVWLDRGELEKILALEAGGGAGLPFARPQHSDDHDRHDDHDDDHHDRGAYGQPGHGRRRRGFLGGIFDSLGGDD